MDEFNADDFNHISHYLDQQQNYPWVADLIDPTPATDATAAIHLNSNAHQDAAPNVAIAPYITSLGISLGHGSYDNGTIDSFTHSTGHQNSMLATSVPITLYRGSAFDNGLPIGPPVIAGQAFAPPNPEDFNLITQQYQSNNIFPVTADMGDIVLEHPQDTPSGQQTQAGEDASLKCIFIGCENGEVFPTKPALKRHQDKHTRPYIYCQYPCTNKSFGEKAGLQRHEREVHGSEAEAFFCPVRSCKRNKRGFHRKYNLLDHQKRSHGLCHSAFSQRGLDSLNNSSERGNSQELQFETGEEGEESAMMGDQLMMVSRGDGETGTSQDLKAKLHHLRSMRAELDKDITLLESALRIMEGVSL